jgi:hypothetical protein
VARRLQGNPLVVGGDPADGDKAPQQNGHRNREHEQARNPDDEKAQGQLPTEILREGLLGHHEEVIHQQHEEIERQPQHRRAEQLAQHVAREAVGEHRKGV